LSIVSKGGRNYSRMGDAGECFCRARAVFISGDRAAASGLVSASRFRFEWNL
jgi:hypothetical protein